MNKSALLSTTAIGLLLSLSPAGAQTKGPDEKAPPGAATGQAAPEKQSQGQESQEKGPRAQGERKGSEAPKSAEPAQKNKGAAEAPGSQDKSKGTAEKQAEPKDKSTKGTAEKAPEPKDKSTKGTAEKQPGSKDKATKGAEKGDPAGSGARVQLTEEKRSNVGQTLAKEKNLNRATRINVTVNVGTRLPRTVRLAVLPASIVAIVPEYRSYRYVVVEDRICIVEPTSFEIVEVIPVSGQTAARSGGGATLVLTEEERRIILAEIDMAGGSTMGLGALSEGGEVPRGVKLRSFPGSVVDKVPKVRNYQFFTVEDRVAIVDRQGAKVELVLENRR